MRSGILALISTVAMATIATAEEPIRVFVSWPGYEYRPFYTWDPKTGTFGGIDPEVITAVFKDQNIEWTFVSPKLPGSRQPRIEVLEKGLADVSIRSFSITAERKKRVDFSAPYFTDGLGVLVRAGSRLSTIEDLKGRKTLAFVNTTGYRYAARQGLEAGLVTEIADPDHIKAPHREVTAGTVDAFINDKSYLDWVASRDKAVKVWPKRLTSDSWGIAVKKGNEKLLTRINAGLEGLIRSGKVKAIFEKHGVKWDLRKD